MRHIYAIAAGLLLLTSSAHAGRYGFSVGASDSLSTTTSCEEIKAVSGTDANSKNVPNGARLGVLHGELSSISSATQVLWYIALDSAGEIAITDRVTETILDDDGDNTGSVATAIDVPYALTADSTQGSLWVCAETDAGTASLISRIHWEVQ